MRGLVLIGLLLTTSSVGARELMSGVVRDPDGGALPGASIYLRDTRLFAISDGNGRFAIEGEFEGPGVLVVTLAGFRASEITLELDASEPPPSVSVTMTLSGYSEAVTVRAAPTPPAAPLPHHFRVGTLDIYRTAGTNADPLLAAQMLPGVAKADEGAGLFVRGGDVHETRTFLDRAVLDHPYRFESVNGGLFGTVPPFLITGLSLSAGGFPARYGDTLSGVLELHGLDRPASSSTFVTVGLAAASAQVSLPLGERAGVRVSGNQSFTRLLFAVNRPEQHFARHPSGTDLSVAGYFESPRLGRFSTTLFRASEQVGVEVEEEAFRGDLDSDSQNELVSLRWSRTFRQRFVAEVTLSQSRYRQTTDVGVIELSSHDRGRRARLDVAGPWRSFFLRFGAESERRHDALDGTSTRRGGDLGGASGLRSWNLDFPSSRDGAYFEVERVFGRIETNVGMRLDHYETFGRSVHDPRASVSVRLAGPHRLRLAWGRYHQAPSAGYLDPSWGNPALSVMGSRHLVVGYGMGSPEDSVHLRIEAYDKSYDGLPVEDAKENFVDSGTGSARGVDVFVRASGGEAWDAWASYGLLTARRRSTRLADFGRYPTSDVPVRPDFEIPHTFQMALRRALPNNVTVTGSLRLASGKPYTPVVDARPSGSGYVPVYGSLNSERSPRYQRVDVALSHIRMLGESSAAVLFVGVTNALGRRNIFGYTYSPDFTTRRPQRSSFGRSVYFGVSFQR